MLRLAYLLPLLAVVFLSVLAASPAMAQFDPHAPDASDWKPDEGGNLYRDIDGGRQFADGSTIHTFNDAISAASAEGFAAARKYDTIDRELKRRGVLLTTYDNDRGLLQHLTPCLFVPDPAALQAGVDDYLAQARSAGAQSQRRAFARACLARLQTDQKATLAGPESWLLYLALSRDQKNAMAAEDDLALPLAEAIYYSYALYDGLAQPTQPGFQLLLGECHVVVARKAQAGDPEFADKLRWYVKMAITAGLRQCEYDAFVRRRQAARAMLLSLDDAAASVAEARKQAYAFIQGHWDTAPQEQQLTRSGLFPVSDPWTYYYNGRFGFWYDPKHAAR